MALGASTPPAPCHRETALPTLLTSSSNRRTGTVPSRARFRRSSTVTVASGRLTWWRTRDRGAVDGAESFLVGQEHDASTQGPRARQPCPAGHRGRDRELACSPARSGRPLRSLPEGEGERVQKRFQSLRQKHSGPGTCSRSCSRGLCPQIFAAVVLSGIGLGLCVCELFAKALAICSVFIKRGQISFLLCSLGYLGYFGIICSLKV